MAVDVEGANTELSFAPGYSEHTVAVLREAGCTGEEIENLKEQSVVPG